MGMDVIGANPKNETGEYFRNNVWWWHPLWAYCLNLHGDIAGKVVNGDLNEGDGLGAEDAELLGKRLMEDISSGVTAEYANEYRAHLAGLPMEDCEYCQATGIRSDDRGIEMGFPTKELEPDVAVLLGRTHGWCNACQGEGRVHNFATNYPFDVENVQKFADFLVNSGGFAIW